MKERLETGRAAGTEFPTTTGRACHRHGQRDGDKTLPLHIPQLEGQQGPFLGSHIPLWDLEKVGRGWERGKAAGKESPPRDGSQDPGLPRPSQDSLRLGFMLGCQAEEKTCVLDHFGALKLGMRLE